MKSETSAASTETIEGRRVKRKTSAPCSEISELYEIKLNDITEHSKREIDDASRRSNEQMEMMMKESIFSNHQSNEMMLQTVNAQLMRVNTTNPDNRTHAKKQNIDELHQIQEDQTQLRAVATGFHEDTLEQGARELLTATILEGRNVDRGSSN